MKRVSWWSSSYSASSTASTRSSSLPFSNKFYRRLTSAPCPNPPSHWCNIPAPCSTKVAPWSGITTAPTQFKLISASSRETNKASAYLRGVPISYRPMTRNVFLSLTAGILIKPVQTTQMESGCSFLPSLKPASNTLPNNYHTIIKPAKFLLNCLKTRWWWTRRRKIFINKRRTTILKLRSKTPVSRPCPCSWRPSSSFLCWWICRRSSFPFWPSNFANGFARRWTSPSGTPSPAWITRSRTSGCWTTICSLVRPRSTAPSMTISR